MTSFFSKITKSSGAEKAGFPWSQKRPSGSSPFPRIDHATDAISLNGEIWIFGGSFKNQPRKDLFFIDPASFECSVQSTKGEVPSPRTHHTAVIIKDYLLAFGGMPKIEDDGLYILNINKKQWTRLNMDGQVPRGRYGHSAVTIGTTMYIFGGEVDGQYLNDLVAFDIKTLSSSPRWEFIQSGNEGPQGRRGHVSVAFQDRIYIFGGTDGEKFFNDIWCYDLLLKMWIPVEATGFVPPPREAAAATIVNDVMYVFGGRSAEGKELGDLGAFRISNSRWFKFEKLGPAPMPRAGHKLVAVKDKIIVLGGDLGPGPDKDDSAFIHILDTSRIKYPLNPAPNPVQTTSLQNSATGPGTPSPTSSQNSFQGPNPLSQPIPVPMHQPMHQPMHSPNQGPFPGPPQQPPPSNFQHRQSSKPPPDTSMQMEYPFPGPMPGSQSSETQAFVPLQRAGSLSNSNLADQPPQGLGPNSSAGPNNPNNRASAYPQSTSPANVDQGRPARHASMVPEAALRRPRPSSPLPLPGEEADAYRNQPPLSPTGLSPYPQNPPRPSSPMSLGPTNQQDMRMSRAPGVDVGGGMRMPGPPTGPPPNGAGNFVGSGPPRRPAPAGELSDPNLPPPRPSREGVDMNMGPAYRNTMAAAPNGHATPSPQIGPHDPRRPKSNLPGSEDGRFEEARSPSPPVMRGSPGVRPMNMETQNLRNEAQYADATRTPSPIGIGRPQQRPPMAGGPQGPPTAGGPQPTNLGVPGTPPGAIQTRPPPARLSSVPQLGSGPQTGSASAIPSRLSSVPQQPASPTSPRPPGSPTSTRPRQAPERQNSISEDKEKDERYNLIREIKARDVIIQDMRKKEQWWRAEVSVARKLRSSMNRNSIQSLNDKGETDEEEDLMMDVGDIGSDKYKIFDALVKVKIELRRSKASIATQAQQASQKITQAERMRTAALQEAAYFKSKLTAIQSGRESELTRIETSRAQDLEKRLAAVLSDNDALQHKITQISKQHHHEHSARQSAEERASEASARAEEAQNAHARSLDELASLHQRVTTAEARLRDHTMRDVDSATQLTFHQTENDKIKAELDNLRDQVKRSAKVIEKSHVAVRAATERASEAEELWSRSQAQISELENGAATLRNEVQARTREFEREQGRANEMERLWKKAREEGNAVRGMMEDVELFSGNSQISRTINGDGSEEGKISELEEQLEMLRTMNKDTQALADRASVSLSDAMVKISQLEASGMRARKEVLTLKQRLADAVDEVAKMKANMIEKDDALSEKIRDLEDAEVRIGMMREFMVQKGFKIDENALAAPKSTSIQKIRELEQALILSEEHHASQASSLAEAQQALEESTRSRQQLLDAEAEARERAQEAEQRIRELENEVKQDSKKGDRNSTLMAISLAQASRLQSDTQIRAAEARALNAENALTEVKTQSQQKISNLEQEYQTALSYVNGAEEMLRHVKSELEVAQNKVSELTQDIVVYDNQNRELSDKLLNSEGLEEEKKMWEDEKVVLDSQIAELQERSAKLDNSLLEFKARTDDLSLQIQQMYEEKNKLESDHKSLRTRYSELKREAKRLQEVAQVKERELEDLLAQNDNLNKELQEAVQAAASNDEQAGAAWNEHRAHLESEVANAQQMINRLQEEKHHLQNHSVDLENKIALLLDQIDHSEDGEDDDDNDDYADDTHDEETEDSQRNSGRIHSLSNELDMLESKYEHHSNDKDLHNHSQGGYMGGNGQYHSYVNQEQDGDDSRAYADDVYGEDEDNWEEQSPEAYEDMINSLEAVSLQAQQLGEKKKTKA